MITRLILQIKRGDSNGLVLDCGGWCELMRLDYARGEYNLVNRVWEL